MGRALFVTTSFTHSKINHGDARPARRHVTHLSQLARWRRLALVLRDWHDSILVHMRKKKPASCVKHGRAENFNRVNSKPQMGIRSIEHGKRKAFR
jgi:hypothetical protein